MERIGAALILIENKEHINRVNQILSVHSNIIIGRQGLPIRGHEAGIISLLLEGSSDQISALTGQLGRVEGVQVKSVLLKTSDPGF